MPKHGLKGSVFTRGMQYGKDPLGYNPSTHFTHASLAQLDWPFESTGKARQLKQLTTVFSAVIATIVLTACISPPIALTPATTERLRAQAPVRFVLSFDDGPSNSSVANPTKAVLDSLADNPVQAGIKALFFVQTAAAGAGGGPIGHQLMQREFADGHVIGFHTSTPGHTNHRKLDPEQLEQSLTAGGNAIAAVTGAPPVFVRPPFWNYDQRTFAAYQQHGMRVVLTDLSANDGKIYGYNMSLRRRANMLRGMSEVRERIAAGGIPAVDGVTPVIVTFHDINRYSARHIKEYLQILIDSARETGVTLAAKPFYDDRGAIQSAVMARTIKTAGEAVHLPGFWNWVWDGDSH